MPPAASQAPRPGPRAALRPLLLDLAVPLGSYYLLHAAGAGLVTALAASSIWPAARTLTAVVRDRTVNGLAALMLAVNVVAMVISFWSGDPRLMLAKDGAVTSTIGIAILVSAFTARPMMTAGMRPFLVKGDAARDAAFTALLGASARFRWLERMFSVTWGIALLAECVVRVACAFTIPVATMIWLSTVITIGSIAVAILVSSIFCSAPMETMVKAAAAATTQTAQ